MRRGFLLLPLVALSFSCMVAVKPTLLTTSKPNDEVVNIAVRTLAQHGFTTSRIDEAAGVVMTDWQATDFLLGSGPTGRDAYVVRRFLVTVAPAGGASEVRVTVEDMRCEDPGMVTAHDSGEHAGCAAVEGIVPPDQEKLDAVGADLERALRS
jgi:hypothetical protein